MDEDWKKLLEGIKKESFKDRVLIYSCFVLMMVASGCIITAGTIILLLNLGVIR